MTIAILFPGQGSQYLGMCRELISTDPMVAEIFAEADEALGFSLRRHVLEGKLEELTRSDIAQPAVVTASYALYRLFARETCASPNYAAGHSLGEISAMIAAGALPFAEGVRYVQRRGALMKRAVQEGKGRAGIVIDMPQSELEQVVASLRADEREYVAISGYNSPRQFIVAGTAGGLRLLEEAIEPYGGELIPFRMMPMKEDAPYHSQLMEFMRPELDEALSTLTFQPPAFPVWSTVSGELVTTAEAIPPLLSSQLVRPVCWNQAIGHLLKRGVHLWVDIGPGVIVRNLLRENSRVPDGYAFDETSDRQRLLQALV
ncbi:ACP S-malonyltransferase [Paenibacillus caui]|uniref:ACP S-malonyltransferase n=1 Tax=Paenibacillus caui TaxID=2873927 RepID=UPI001CA83A1B|nr:ACP S-malonyltransferase [Paenibacillus caui]